MKRIVVVDDQPILGSIYRGKFTAEGFQVDVAADGKQALELIERTNPDVVLLDLMLPKVDGLEVIKRLRAQPSFMNLPIIVFSSSARAGISEEAFAAGATMVLSKSTTSPKQVIELVNRALAETPQLHAPANISESPIAHTRKLQVAETLGAIILLEGHADTRSIISHILRRKGHQVTNVLTETDALMLAKSNEVDLFLINRGQGDSAASFCWEVHTEFPDKPIMVYSTVASVAERDEVLRAGAFKYLSTPEDLLNLAEISASVIADSRSRSGAAHLRDITFSKRNNAPLAGHNALVN